MVAGRGWGRSLRLVDQEIDPKVISGAAVHPRGGDYMAPSDAERREGGPDLLFDPRAQPRRPLFLNNHTD